MRLAQTISEYTTEDRRWLAYFPPEDTFGATLDGDAFTTTFADGVVPSGVVLGRITASGLFAPYAPAATDGTETAVGHLLNTLTGVEAGTRTSTGVYYVGRVYRDLLPASSGIDAAAETDLARITYQNYA